jgi:hypothetical protein
MKTFLLSFSLLGVFLVSPLPAEDTASARADRDAQAKIATEQRLAYAASAEYNPYDTKNRDFQKNAGELLQKGDYASAIAEAKKGLALARYDIDLLIILASAYRDAGDIPNADKTRVRWMSLVDSILRSGDGRDFATAFQVINVAEEYAVLRVVGLQVTNQSLIAHEGSEFDEMHVKDPKSGNELTLYFNVDLPMKWLNRQFSDKKK